MPTEILKLTHDAMRKCFPGAPDAIINAFVSDQASLAKAGILDTPERLAYCFANLSAEVDGFRLKGLTENINYTHRRAAEVWPNRFDSAADVASQYGEDAGWQLRMFDDVYGNRMGNRPGTRDGSTFIGRGGPQITGRDGYATVGKMIGVNLVDNPTMATKPDLQPAITAAYWTWKQMNGPADAGNFSGNNGVVHRWNGGFNGLADRKAALARVLPVARSLDRVTASVSAPASRAMTAADLLAAMRRRGDPVAEGPDVGNIVFIRGMGVDLVPNGNPFNNKFNDVNVVLRVIDGKPVITDKWPCTVDPGKHFVFNRMNPAGAATIAPGYYPSYQVGMHPMSRPNHEALVQSAGDVTVYSDDNEDGATHDSAGAPDKKRTGRFGINVHGPGTGFGDRLLTDIGRVSAGCLVVPSMPMQRERMSVFKKFATYRANRRAVFGISIFDAKDVMPSSAPLVIAAGGTTTLAIASTAAWVDSHQAIAVMIGALFALAIGFAVWWYHNRSEENVAVNPDVRPADDSGSGDRPKRRSVRKVARKPRRKAVGNVKR